MDLQQIFLSFFFAAATFGILQLSWKNLEGRKSVLIQQNTIKLSRFVNATGEFSVCMYICMYVCFGLGWLVGWLVGWCVCILHMKADNIHVC